MYWRDKVILEVAKKMQERFRYDDGCITWEDCDQAAWIATAEDAIKDVRDGSKEAGWSIEFVKGLP